MLKSPEPLECKCENCLHFSEEMRVVVTDMKGFSLKGFNRFRKVVYEEYKDNGFAEFWNNHKDLGDLAEIGLIHTEVSEAQESIRDNNYHNLSLELADIIIRVMNFASRKGINLEKFLVQKATENMDRPKKHGRVLI